MQVETALGLMLEKLLESGITSAQARTLGFKALEADKAEELLGLDKRGFLIPYYGMDGKVTKFWRYRFLGQHQNGFEKMAGIKLQRYTQAAKSGCEAYFCKLIDWRELSKDATKTLIITEGEIKAACACINGHATIGLGGVWNFRNGKRGQLILPSLRKINWEGRRVIVCFDSDAVRNPNVLSAENALCEELIQLKAVPCIARIPEQEGRKKMGLDDFIVAAGVEAFNELVSTAKSWESFAELAKLNEEVVYVQDPGMIMRLDTRQKMQVGAFTEHAYATRFMVKLDKDGNAKKVPTAKSWLTWEGRSEVQRLTYLPGQDVFVDGRMNTWQGWGIEPKKGDITPWRTLLDFLFKGTTKENRKWFEQWLAFQVQNPGVKMFTAVVFWSLVHGVGKSLVGYTMARVFGKNFAEIEDKDLLGGFNCWAEGKQFVMGDEITGGDKRHAADRMKSLITQREIRINIKYVPSYVQPDCINYFFTSNHPDAFFLEDTDRRFFVIEVAGSPLSTEWYQQVYDPWYKGEDGPAALFHYLLNMDLTGFDHRSPAPMTEAKAEMISDGRSDIATWVHAHKQDPPKDKTLWTTEELLARYDPMKSSRVTANGMSRELKRSRVARVLGGQQLKDTDGRSVRLWTFDPAVAKLGRKDLVDLRAFECLSSCKKKTKKYA